jgi:hypothetical protein
MSQSSLASAKIAVPKEGRARLFLGERPRSRWALLGALTAARNAELDAKLGQTY